MSNEIPIEPMGMRILLKDIKEKSVETDSGIVLAVNESSQLAKRAEVVAIGGEVPLDKFLLEKGDLVFYNKKMIDTFTYNLEDYFFAVPKEITAKVNKDRINELN